jgi:pimeloyl-ACP methyl ester carboxylesterase
MPPNHRVENDAKHSRAPPPLFKRIRAAFEKCMPSAKLAVVPKAGHQMHQMNASGFNAALVKFLSE